jgi:hypothetical protein
MPIPNKILRAHKNRLDVLKNRFSSRKMKKYPKIKKNSKTY